MNPRVGVAQFTGSINWEENVAAVNRLAAEAAEAGVNMLAFHELASTIYPPYAENPDLFRLAEPEDGPSVAAARDIARHNEMLLVYPFYERDGERLYNSAMIFGPKGERLAKYRKSSVPASRLMPG
ncbi:MAG: carbon-nitrogen hydrolase family protein, partial [Candidatus Binataceae bacterium]